MNMAGDIGTIRLNKLLSYFGSPEKIFQAPADKLTRVSGIGESVARNILCLKEQDIAKELALAEKYGLKIIALEDRGYPHNLKYIPDPPIVLYVKGELKPEDALSVAIVGSRRASLYGLGAAEKFSAELAERGFSVVSGMARGIDTAAHKGALKNFGRTIAVMGSGFARIYPEENKGLADKIAESGAVISEFPVNTGPLKQNFPRRNRIISGLSLGTLVVEAARNSGALISADFALEQGREVFALPGRIDSGNSFGTNELIKQGAKLVSCVDEIIQEFGFANDMPEEPKARRQIARPTELSGREADLYRLFSKEPFAFDQILEKAQGDIGEVSALLLKLQAQKLIRRIPGNQYLKAGA